MDARTASVRREVPISVGLYKAFAPVAQFEFKSSQLLALQFLSQRLQRQRGGLVLLSAPGKGDEIRNPVALQGEIVPSDLFGWAMPGDEGPLERAQEASARFREMLGGRFLRGQVLLKRTR